MNADQYREALQAHLPPGLAFTRDPGAVLTALLDGFAQEFARNEGRGLQLLDETDPRTTSELLADWERVANLPDPCVTTMQSIAQRQAALLARIIDAGGQSRQHFIDTAAALGITVTITEFAAQTVNSDVTSPIYDSRWRFAWQANAPLNTVVILDVNGSAADALASWSNEALECRLRRLKPAHTEVLFSYT